MGKTFQRRGNQRFRRKTWKGYWRKKGRPRNCPKDPTERIKYLETENEMLKKLLGM